VCKSCQTAVRPKQITTHLRSVSHKRNISFCITEDIQQYILTRWSEIGEVFDYSEITNRTNNSPERLEDLPVFEDGIQCRRGSDCQYIYRTIKGIKEYWRIHHHWLVPRLSSLTTQSELDQYTQRVPCQRLFRQGPHSNFFTIQSAVRVPNPRPEALSVDTLLEQLETQHQRIFRPSICTVETTEINKATPWLRRTRWTQYLAGRPSETLLPLIQIPDPDPEDPVSQICQAVNYMACTSQQIAKQCGYLIRTEIVRTETDTLPKTPLQAYIDLESITKHIHLWQQIVCFFARTQQAPNTDCPYYRFNRRQHHTWNTLWRLALSAASAISVADSSDPLEKEESCTNSEPPTKFHYRPLENTCLDFCLEFLNQQIGADEYEYSLICTLAVLGRSRTG